MSKGLKDFSDYVSNNYSGYSRIVIMNAIEDFDESFNNGLTVTESVKTARIIKR